MPKQGPSYKEFESEAYIMCLSGKLYIYALGEDSKSIYELLKKAYSEPVV
jgi:hypothetical protein